MNAVASMKNRPGSSRPAAGGLTTSWLLATALPVCFGLVPLQAEATGDLVGGDNTTNAQSVTSNVFWTPLAEVEVQNPEANYCTATCSADALNPAPLGGHQYRFRVSLNSTGGVNGPNERTLGFQNTQVQLVPPIFVRDNSIKEITTTGGLFLPVDDDDIIKCEALKFLAATPNLIVDDVSLTVTCTDDRLP